MPVGNVPADSILSVVVSATADGDNTVLAAPGAGVKYRVLGFYLTADAAGLFLLQSDASANVETVHARFEVVAAGIAQRFAGGLECPAFTTVANQPLVLVTTSSQDVEGFVVYTLA